MFYILLYLTVVPELAVVTCNNEDLFQLPYTKISTTVRIVDRSTFKS